MSLMRYSEQWVQFRDESDNILKEEHGNIMTR